MKALYILKAGVKLPSLVNKPGDFHHWITNDMQLGDFPLEIIDMCNSGSLPSLEDVAGVVVTGSSSMVTDREEWSERTAQWLNVVAQNDIPVLGICYGHQLLAHALGGKVSDNPAGIEVGTVDTVLTGDSQDDPLLKGVSSPLKVHASHKQCVTELPHHAVRLASSSLDKNHAFRIGTQVWGLQFHPEFDAEITQHYVNYYRSELDAQGIDANGLIGGCEDNGVGRVILQRFFKHVVGMQRC